MQIRIFILRALTACSAALLSLSMFAQTITVSGTILDTDGQAVIGASVLVQGATTGTVTDIDGKYTLPGVPSNATLQISSIGFKTETVAVNGRRTIDVTLAIDTEMLDETIVVGYAVGNKRSFSGTVERVRAEDMNEGFIGTPLDAIRG